MPYVPSKKTDGKSSDREIIDEALRPLVQKVAKEITNNFSLRKIYQRVFVEVASNLQYFLWKKPITVSSSYLEWELAKAICIASAKSDYGGAYLGEFNYAITRFIQRVPQIKVERGDWEDEFRYWLYAETVSALIYASRHTESLNIGVDGVFIDIKDEYKWRVNRSYETAQIIKSGDCYSTPYYNKPVEVVNEIGIHVGYVYIDVKRDKMTLNIDELDYQLVLKKKNQ